MIGYLASFIMVGILMFGVIFLTLSEKEIGKVSTSEIAEKINLNEGTAGVYLHEYRVLKKIRRSTTKDVVFSYLALLSEEEFSNNTYTKLAKILKINQNTASKYLADYRKFLLENTHPNSKSFLELAFQFMDKNPDKRTSLDIIRRYPYIKFASRIFLSFKKKIKKVDFSIS